ncbi:MAG TPA: helix-turn-helix domain-containing protein [Candidatus Humimicrobiaceae bacterium]
MQRIDELLVLTDENTTKTDKNLIELDMLSGIVEEYEDIHYPIGVPTLVDVLKLRMYEMQLTQKNVSEMLNVSQSRVSEYLTGRSEPTLKIGRDMSRKLKIDASIILGV